MDVHHVLVGMIEVINPVSGARRRANPQVGGRRRR